TEAEVIAGVAAAQKLAAEAQARMSAAEPPADPAPAPAEAASPVTAAPMTAAQRNQAMWATAMANVAEKYTAGLAHLPPAERKAASIRAAALTSTANALLSGTGAPPLKPGALSAIIRPNSN
ncbi:MAG: hypothetical protein P4L90_00070, partial [Rhodopila sp.]|nr:hypothetical protein [Rhodopila sp.]